jgi:hypothetical protein
VRLVGRVGSLADDGRSLEVKTGGGTLAVALEDGHRPATLEPVLLADADDGAPVFVLGRKQAAERDPNTQLTQPAQVVQIHSIVVLDAEGAFAPPPPTAKQQERRLDWLAGKLKKTASGFAIDLGGEELNMQWGRERPVLLAAQAAAGALAKGATVLVIAEPKGKRALERGRVAVVGKKAPADQVSALVE